MNLHASQAEIDVLEGVLRRAASGGSVVAAKVALAWHLRQRDSGRTLQLVQEVMPVVRAARASQADAAASCHARAALAAAEASALFDEAVEAERLLTDARANLDPAWDPQAEGDAWLVESLVARTRGQAERALAALRQAARCYARLGDDERLEVAQSWITWEHMATCPDVDAIDAAAGTDPDDLDGDSARDAILGAARALALACRNPAGATRLFTRAGQIAHARGLVQLEMACLLEAGAAVRELGDYERAARSFDAAAARARATRWPALIVACDTHLGALLCDLGAFEDSRRTLEASVDALSARSRGVLLANAHAALASTLLAMRRTSESVAQMDAAMDLFRAAGGLRDLALNLVRQGRIFTAALQPGRASDALAEARMLIDARGLDAMHVALQEAQADLHHRFTIAPPAGMTLPSAALHFAEAALAAGQKLMGWDARAAQLDFVAERWADAGDHERAYGYARRALAAKERETAQKMSYPLALLRVRRHAEVRAMPEGARDGAASRAAPQAPSPH